jgi:hypothetical protein
MRRWEFITIVGVATVVLPFAALNFKIEEADAEAGAKRLGLEEAQSASATASPII